MKKILCPVDGSNTANNAVEYAAKMAKDIKAELVLMEIVSAAGLQEISNLEKGLPATVNERLHNEKSLLDEYCELVESNFSVKCTAKVKSSVSNVDKVLLKEIEYDNYDLIIMGTNGADDINQFYFGTHTYHIIQGTNCPVLMVPENCIYQKAENIVYATDYTKEDISAIRQMAMLTLQLNPKLTLLHISEKVSEVSDEVYRSFKHLFEDEPDICCTCFERVINEDVPAAIHSYMKAHDNSLLVLLGRKHSVLENIFRKSVTKELSFIASYPMLVMMTED